MRSVLVAFVSLAAAACMSFPESGSQLESYYDVVEFSGWSGTPGAEIEIQVWNHRDQAYETIGGTTVFPRQPALLKTIQGDLYYWSIRLPIASEGDAETLCRWNTDCRDSSSDGAGWDVTRVRALGPAPESGFVFPQYTFDAGGFQCAKAKWREDGDQFDVVAAYLGCRADDPSHATLAVRRSPEVSDATSR